MFFFNDNSSDLISYYWI